MVEKQTVIRLNRDTLYSFAVVDISGGAMLAVPDAGERYLSVMVVNEDHFINQVFHDSGQLRARGQDLDSPYVVVGRTLVDPCDPSDLAAMAEVQDQLAVEPCRRSPPTRRPSPVASDGGGCRPGPPPHLRGRRLGRPPGLRPTYVSVSPGLPVGEYELAVGDDVPVDGFWSISVYNADGYFEPNEQGAYSVNDITAARNDDVSVTVRFGGEGPTRCPSPTAGTTWSASRPRAEILNGDWTFPTLDE